jgi:hypothetical protein
MTTRILFSVCLLGLLTGAAGCGQNILKGMEDQESTEAKQYAGLKSLDSGDFQTVLNACFEADGTLKPSANATDCSAAALGAAGLDPLDIAKQLNDLINTASTGDISAIGGLSIDPQYLDEIHKANAALKLDCEDPNNSDAQNACSQLVVTSIAEVVMALAQVGANSGVSGIDVGDGIDSTEAALIADLFTGTPMVDANGTGTADTSVVDIIEGDALNIINNVDNSPLAGTDLGNVIQDQVNTIGGSDCASGSTVCDVSSTDLSNYLNTQYGK